jgi:hypothetical protein
MSSTTVVLLAGLAMLALAAGVITVAIRELRKEGRERRRRYLYRGRDAAAPAERRAAASDR